MAGRRRNVVVRGQHVQRAPLRRCSGRGGGGLCARARLSLSLSPRSSHGRSPHNNPLFFRPSCCRFPPGMRSIHPHKWVTLSMCAFHSFFRFVLNNCGPSTRVCAAEPEQTMRRPAGYRGGGRGGRGGNTDGQRSWFRTRGREDTRTRGREDTRTRGHEDTRTRGRGWRTGREGVSHREPRAGVARVARDGQAVREVARLQRRPRGN